MMQYLRTFEALSWNYEEINSSDYDIQVYYGGNPEFDTRTDREDANKEKFTDVEKQKIKSFWSQYKLKGSVRRRIQLESLVLQRIYSPEYVVSFTVYKTKDEWYYVEEWHYKSDVEVENHFYRCDQWEGLEQLIHHQMT